MSIPRNRQDTAVNSATSCPNPSGAKTIIDICIFRIDTNLLAIAKTVNYSAAVFIR